MPRSSFNVLLLCLARSSTYRCQVARKFHFISAEVLLHYCSIVRLSCVSAVVFKAIFVFRGLALFAFFGYIRPVSESKAPRTKYRRHGPPSSRIPVHSSSSRNSSSSSNQ